MDRASDQFCREPQVIVKNMFIVQMFLLAISQFFSTLLAFFRVAVIDRLKN
jgi:hypothetical protein